ncbi:MAG TPA: Ig-like domain-containing protein, partial [Acidobacteriota bacterium]|nr:Ig-like domain-containing protein [Acidobacteriota bacterium]
IDVFGPRVASCSLAGQTVAGPVAGFSVTFDEPLDPATFTAAEILVTGPLGAGIPLATPVDSGDGMTFTVNLLDQIGMAGTYTISVLTGVTDLARNPLDQNKNGISGDGYSTSLTIADAGLTPAGYPFHESLDVGFGTRDCWRFTSTASGRVQLVTDSGDLVLQMDSSPNAWTTNEAILAIDLAGQSAVKLFWDEYNRYDEANAGDSGDGVFASFDQGTTWTRIADLAPTNTSSWQRREVDMDAALDTALGDGGWAYSSNVWIKWQHYGYYGWYTDGRQFDDFAVSWERTGPKVLSHSPTRVPDASPSLSSLAITFNEDVLPETFTIDDIVSFAGPSGDLLSTITGISGSGTGYTVSFAEQTRAGVYTMVIGPYIHDLAMAPMDQDGSGMTHTVTDRYTARVTLGANPGLPLYEAFANPSALQAWDFWSSGKGRVQIANERIQMDSASGYALNEAILHVDMTGVMQDVTLKFYHLRNGDETHYDSLAVGSTFTGHRNADLVAVSSDGGGTWKVVLLLAGNG